MRNVRAGGCSAARPHALTIAAVATAAAALGLVACGSTSPRATPICSAKGYGIRIGLNGATGGIVGVGWVNKPAGVRWGVALRIVWAWLFTIPAAATVAAACFWLDRALAR